jgi:hypothetical protein
MGVFEQSATSLEKTVVLIYVCMWSNTIQYDLFYLHQLMHT